MDEDEGFDYAGFFGGLATTAGQTAKDLLKKDAKPSPQNATQPRPAQPWIPWAIGGGILVVVLLVAGLAFGRGK